jgi:uncharacterized protein (UPF0264 family)
VKLLISVSNAAEASDALAGGADIIDAKDPRRGALGAVTLDVLRDIVDVVGTSQPVSAALGDAHDETAIGQQARAYAAAGARYLKVGFAGVTSRDRVMSLLTAAVSAAETAAECGVIAVAYADEGSMTGLAAACLVDVAAKAGAEGVLLDTLHKHRPGLRGLMTPAALGAWVAGVHARGLLVALAGKLTATDLPRMHDAGADIAGVRGAACQGGRTAGISAEKVRVLRDVCQRLVPAGLVDT